MHNAQCLLSNQYFKLNVMKDILISVARQKAEIKLFIACFFASILLNVISILVYQTSWSEMYTQWIWLLIIWAAFYALTVALRVIYYIAKYFLKK